MIDCTIQGTTWTFVFEDFNSNAFPKGYCVQQAISKVNYLAMSGGDNCCIIKNEEGISSIWHNSHTSNDLLLCAP